MFISARPVAVHGRLSAGIAASLVARLVGRLVGSRGIAAGGMGLVLQLRLCRAARLGSAKRRTTAQQVLLSSAAPLIVKSTCKDRFAV